MPRAFALGQVLIGKTFPKIWCNKTKPKKSYEGPKLRYLHFVWGFSISVHGDFGGIKNQEGVGIKARGYLQ